MSGAKPLRLFLDSNVVTGGIVAAWGLDRGVLSLCSARICGMVLAQYVREEVEENLLSRAAEFSLTRAEQLIEDYGKLLRLARPEIVPVPSSAEVARSRHLIRHAADVPVLLSAVRAQPDWLLTHNTKHFTPAVAKRADLRIATPSDFFRALARGIYN